MCYIVSLEQHKIIQFDISMTDIILMQVMQSMEYLLHDGGSLILWELVLIINVILKRFSFTVFHYYE